MARRLLGMLLMITLAGCGGPAGPPAAPPLAADARAGAMPARGVMSTNPVASPVPTSAAPSGPADAAQALASDSRLAGSATEPGAAPAVGAVGALLPTRTPRSAPEITWPPRATPTATPPAATPQVRALWVDAFKPGIHTPAEVRQLVADARAANLNTLIVQVRRRGDAFYRSNIEPFVESADEPAPVPAGFDPLGALIAEAHANGLEVHAWIATLPVWHVNPKYQTSSRQHVWHRHGPQAAGRDNWVMMKRGADGSLSPTYALDPGHPDAAQYTVEVALDLVRSYEIDGLHLDYIRYGDGGNAEGYNPTAVARFNAATGRSGQPAPDDALWRQWRRDQVTALVRRIYIETTAVRPLLKVSAAVIAWGPGPADEAGWQRSAPYAQVMQDWRAWTSEGILDLVVPMNYDREHNATERGYYDSWLAWQRTHQYGRHVLAGPAGYLNYIEDTLAQIRRASAPAPDGRRLMGVSLYSYAATNVYGNEDFVSNATARDRLPRQPWEYRPELNATALRALSQPTTYRYASGSQTREVHTEPVWPTPARPPAMPWKQTPSTGMLAGQIVAAGGGDGLRVEIGGTTSRLAVSDGSGWFGVIDLPPGHYEARVTSRSGQHSAAMVEVRAGQVSRVRLQLEGAGAGPLAQDGAAQLVQR